VKTHIPAALLTLSALACQSDGATDSLPSQLRDSAGIQVIENARPADGARLGWQIGPEPRLSIGVLEGDEPHMLFNVSDATRLTDGRIVVVNVGTMELRAFDVSGAHVATWGGRGEGPGEFTDLHQVERLPGDSIIAWGWAPGPFTVLDPNGSFVRISSRKLPTAEGPLRQLAPWSVTSDGLILASQYPKLYLVDPLTVEIWDAEGELRSSLGIHPSWEWNDFPNANTRWRETIFGKRLVIAAWGELAIVTLPTRYEIKAYAADGSLARIVRLEHVPRATTAGDVETHIAARVARIAEESTAARTQVREDNEATPVAEYFPAFASVRSDAVGHLWVKEYELPGARRPAQLWTVFDPDGRVLGLVETPLGLEVYEIGEDYILGRVESELGVESVQLWRLDRRSTSQARGSRPNPPEQPEHQVAGLSPTHASES